MKQKKQEDRFLEALLAPLSGSIIQPVISLLKVISRRGVRRAEYMDKNI